MKHDPVVEEFFTTRTKLNTLVPLEDLLKVTGSGVTSAPVLLERPLRVVRLPLPMNEVHSWGIPAVTNSTFPLWVSERRGQQLAQQPLYSPVLPLNPLELTILDRHLLTRSRPLALNTLVFTVKFPPS